VKKPGLFEDYVLWRISYLYLQFSCNSEKNWVHWEIWLYL